MPDAGSAAPAIDPYASGTPGLTPPLSSSHAGRFITDVIVDLGYVPAERVEQVVAEARTAGRSPESLMVEQGLLGADQLSRAVAERYGLQHIDLSIYTVDMAAANMVTVAAARRFRAVPVGFVDSDTLLLAMADPANVLAIDDVQMMTGLNCRVAVAAEVDIDNLINQLNSLESAVTEAVEEDEDEAEIGPAGVTELRESADDAPVIKLVYSILGQAVNDGASDVHFEPEERDMRVRFRVDGVLKEVARVPKRMVAGVVSRIKIMSELDIAEKRIPGRPRRRQRRRPQGRPPRRHRADRARGGGDGPHPRQDPGAADARRARDARRGQAPLPGGVPLEKGLVLVTGPTGSGKSTTLYATLQAINDPGRKIYTVEDPIERKIEGIIQTEVKPLIGLTFAQALRSLVRADPDVIMVGEVRDAETARIAIEAALTGHMVLTTLHTNDAPGAVTRLNKMGIESFLTASAVDCVVAQRLARTLCIDCKRRTVLTRAALEAAGFHVGADVEAWEPVGCARCSGTGYRGRVGLYSVMRMSEELRDLTVQSAPQADLTRVARQEGMSTLREDGLEKVREGLTSIEEVARVAV